MGETQKLLKEFEDIKKQRRGDLDKLNKFEQDKNELLDYIEE